MFSIFAPPERRMGTRSRRGKKAIASKEVGHMTWKDYVADSVLVLVTIGYVLFCVSVVRHWDTVSYQESRSTMIYLIVWMAACGASLLYMLAGTCINAVRFLHQKRSG
jgi:hypothetical protein